MAIKTTTYKCTCTCIHAVDGTNTMSCVCSKSILDSIQKNAQIETHKCTCSDTVQRSVKIKNQISYNYYYKVVFPVFINK